ncbi:MAG: tRNA (adenosine(37)-N6)-dimethylallyltransferase MiaA [Deltaproteobacteria bacterium]|jgi:tRNA dimethylallyltransferase|nr:tRNA (adenosine(37)-N6)-dimethylallyltransferase MiaA [Deltaproteobacteria bacterium]
MPELPRAVCIAGATGTGKSAAALHLASELGGEVINVDSRQVYADFPIITAQPGPKEQLLCPHHLYGFLDTTERINAGQWVRRTAAEIAACVARGNLPLLVGGTGLYIRAITRGMADIPPVEPAVAQRLAEEYARQGPQFLHARLAKADPSYAARTHSNNRHRILRALGVWEGTGRTFSWWHEHGRAHPACRALLLVVRAELEELVPRLDRRINAMLEAGALEEARRAFTKCAAPKAPGWSGIGCAELYRHLCGEWGFEQARTIWLNNTRAYAKRQLTWFRGQEDAAWMAPDDLAGMVAAARAFLKGESAEEK